MTCSPDCLMTSGAIQKGVPTKVFRLLVVLVSCPATPKSASFTSPMSLSSTLAACSNNDTRHYMSSTGIITCPPVQCGHIVPPPRICRQQGFCAPKPLKSSYIVPFPTKLSTARLLCPPYRQKQGYCDPHTRQREEYCPHICHHQGYCTNRPSHLSIEGILCSPTHTSQERGYCTLRT
jgi:hypothetical protein